MAENAKYPMAKMPAFTPEQLAWLRGHFYEEVGSTLEFGPMCRQAGMNKVVTDIEAQTGLVVRKHLSSNQHLKIGG